MITLIMNRTWNILFFSLKPRKDPEKNYLSSSSGSEVSNLKKTLIGVRLNWLIFLIIP